MKQHGLWISPDQFINFADSPASLTEQIATRSRTINFAKLGMYLPNPDPILKAQNADIRVYRDLRSDAHVGGSIRRRQAAVLSLESGLDRGRAPSRVMKQIESMLAELPLKRIIRQILDSTLYGYQPLEIMWRVDSGQLYPADVVGKPPEWFVFDDENRLRFRARDSGLVGELLPEHKFLLARQNPTYDNPYGQPDLAMCFWPTTFKRGGLKFWVKFTQKYGSPWVVGKHPRGTPDSETDALLDQLDAMVEDAVCVIPDDSSVDIKEAVNTSANADAFERLLMFCRSEVSIALLGQNQSTEATANRASAATGHEVTREIRDDDAGIVEEVINALIDSVCALNFGDCERPVWSMWEQEEVDKLLAERDEKLTRAGAKFTNQYFVRAYSLQNGDLVEQPQPTPTPPANFAEVDDDTADYADIATPLLDSAGQAELDTWLSRIRRITETVETLPELADAISNEFAELDTEQLAKAMGLAFSCAELAGRAEVNAGG